MNKLIPILTFVVGAGIGGFATWYFIKDIYEAQKQEEIDSVKETFALHNEPNEEDKPEEKVEDEIIDVDKAKDIIKNSGYISSVTDYNSISKGVESEDTDESDEITIKEEPILEPGEKPYVIAPDEYGEFEDYNRESLIHYSDGKLADIHDNLIDDVDEIVGADYASHFGEYEDDSVHIRNDAKKCDYEILYDERSWVDVLESKPYLKMEE